jgi:hypothetical protein
LFALIVCCSTSVAAQPVPPPPSLGTVLREIPPDLWRFVSTDSATVLVLGGVAATTAHQWDDDLAGEIETNVRLNDAMAAGETYGAFAVQAFVGVGLYAGGWFANKGRLARAGADIMRSQILGQLYVQAIKYTTQRERPDASNHHSFPSGHSASAFATAGVLQRHYGWKVGVPATIVAGYVAASRVHDNRHYLSDVIFGAAMGIAAERTVTLRAGRYGLTVAPSAGPGRAALVVSVRRKLD